MKHINERDNLMADYFSRAPMKVRVIDEEDKERSEYFNFVTTFAEWPIDFEMVAKETEKDSLLREILQKIAKGVWLECKDKEMQQSFRRRDELRKKNRMLVCGYRVVIPKSLQERLVRGCIRHTLSS
ncbi:hypothetical protein HHI36_022013 [Cryptolaemus montrouzieri]|uniref:Uncharacterized protein n=1 Tax=Cryptolaemus montrouzieri TaxID=559131 RepID=A0ABD2MYL2_9CUCU